MPLFSEYIDTVNNENFELITQEDIEDLLSKTDIEEQNSRELELEKWALQIKKSFDYEEDLKNGKLNGLAPFYFSRGVDKNNNQVNVSIPPVTGLIDSDFHYYEKRYNECSGLYPKVQYGLITYFGKKTPFSKRQDFAKTLGLEVKLLADKFYNRAIQNIDKRRMFSDYYDYITIAYNLFYKSRLIDEKKCLVAELHKKINKLDITNREDQDTIWYITDLFVNNSSDIFSLINIQDIIDKNLQVAEEFENNNNYSAQSYLDKIITIKKKLQQPYKELLNHKARISEKYADKRNGNFIKQHFIEESLRFYQVGGDMYKVKELQAKYAESRKDLGLQEFSYVIMRENTDNWKEIFEKYKNKSGHEILTNIAYNYWIDSEEKVKKQISEIPKILGGILPIERYDKIGNLNEYCETTEEIADYYFWKSYDISFQIGFYTLFHLITEAVKQNKITSENLIEYLEKTWYNEPIFHYYNGKKVELKIIDLIKPSIIYLFEEIIKSYADENYEPDFILIIDSLVQKMETILRFYCEKKSIATFKTRVKNGTNLVMEKLLDDLIADVKHTDENETGFDEEDRLMLKYVLTPKGFNLRNKVAHGLMDKDEYSIQFAIVLLYMVITFSRFEFD